MDLRPRLPSPELTMDKLPLNVIGIYVEQLEQGGMRIPFSNFLLALIKHFRVFYKLCKQGHWFSFENKIEGSSKKCFKEITSSLNGWKKKFFLINLRAILDAMPWKHIDTDVRDDFQVNYNEGDADRLAEHIILLRPLPQRLLYMCGLTTDCRHPELAQVIKDPKGQVITMDDFLKLLHWNGTVVSKGKPILDNQRPLKKEKQAIAKIQAKRVGEGSSVTPWKKKARKNGEPTGLKSEGTISVTLIHQAVLKPLNETDA
ncbi:hypothetical protein Tco_0947462 [Tanacetum coccineum]